MGLFNKKDSAPEIPSAPNLPELPKMNDMPPKKALPELPSFPNNPKNEIFNQAMVKSAVSDQGEPVSTAIPAIPEVTGMQPSKFPIESAGLPEVPTFPTTTIPNVPSISEQPVAQPNPEPQTVPKVPSITEEPVKVSIPEVPKSALSPNAPSGYVDSISSKMTLDEEPVEAPAAAPTPTPVPVAAPTPVVRSDEPIFVRIDKFQASQDNFNNIKASIKDIESVFKKIKEVKAKEEEELKGWTEDVEKIKLKLAEIDTEIFSQI